MKLKVFDIIVAEGNEMELALYTHILLESMRLKAEHDKANEASEWLKKYGNMSLEELMRMEQEDDGEE